MIPSGIYKFHVMKKNILFGAIIIFFLAGCSVETLDVVENPVQSGEEIMFGTSLQDDAADTKTVYGDRTSTGIPVYWSPEGDEVAIFCLQSSQPASHLVNYKVMPDADKPSVSASVTKVDSEEAGLQWGQSDEHRFYAFYPASAVKGTEEEDETGKITANIPVTQMVDSWTRGTLNGVNTIFGLPNMDYAYMYAFTSQKKSETPQGTPIDLHFKNLVTVLDITLQGPESGSMVVTNINVNAIDGKNVILTGDFTCNIRAAEDNSSEVTAICEAAGDLNEVRNRISIPCYDRQTNEFITLNAGEQLNVKAYIIPDDDESHIIQPRTLQISVSTLNGAAKTKTLQTAQIVPHKVNRVILPKLTLGGTNYWQSDLDPDIYVTELSLPGSKMSMMTGENGASIVYQNETIDQQLQDGVRAFIFQTQRYSSWGDYQMRIAVDGNVLPMTLQDALSQIASFLNTSESVGRHEVAFVLVTYASGNGSGKQWMELLQEIINDCADNPAYRIYNGDLTPNTTLGDVSNKIIMKANYNDTGMISGVGSAPMLYTIWETPYVEGGLPMTWSNPNGSPAFTWLYQEVTTVLDTDRNENSDAERQATKAEKRQYIETIFNESMEAYKNNEDHDTWFMNDLGGYYYYEDNYHYQYWPPGFVWDSHEDPQGLANDMNNLGVELLQNRTETAGLGIIYMNYADKQSDSGALYQSDWLIQTIIDNNFKFSLRKKSDAASGTQQSRVSVKGNKADRWDSEN